VFLKFLLGHNNLSWVILS